MEHGYQGGQDGGLSIAMDAKDDLYIGGKFWGQGIDFNTSITDTFLLGSNSSNNYDAYLAKYSNTGNLKWAYNFGDSQEEEGTRICIDNTGSIFFASTVAFGSSAGGPIAFDVNPNTFYYFQPLGGYGDVTLTRFSQCILNDNATSTTAGLTALQNGVQYQWVNCGVGYAPISGATSQTFLPTTTGNYACILTSSASCKDTTACLYYDACSSFSTSVTTSLFGVMTASQANASSYQWLSCDANGIYTPIAGANSQTFTPSANGSYACKVTKGACVDTSACVSISNVGISDVEKMKSLRFYPNPTHQQLTIEASMSMNLAITDLLGNVMMNVSNCSIGLNQLNVEALPAGIYFLRCTKNNQSLNHKFIKQ